MYGTRVVSPRELLFQETLPRRAPKTASVPHFDTAGTGRTKAVSWIGEFVIGGLHAPLVIDEATYSWTQAGAAGSRPSAVPRKNLRSP